MVGAGRIGAIHAANLASTGATSLRYVVDVNAEAAAALAAKHGAKVADVRTALADPKVDAVIIASSTDTHADLAIAAAKAGKAIFCEKPIDLSLKRVDSCLAAVRRAGVAMMVGFNRRFDPSFAALKARLDKGEIGALEQVIITSRDPGLAPLEYLKVSGGQFRDMTIHDFDMARFFLGEVVEVHAIGANLIEPYIAEVGDVDSAVVSLRGAGGELGQITNSRRCAFGYDQRVEAFGADGMLSAAVERQFEIIGEALVCLRRIERPAPAAGCGRGIAQTSWRDRLLRGADVLCGFSWQLSGTAARRIKTAAMYFRR